MHNILVREKIFASGFRFDLLLGIIGIAAVVGFSRSAPAAESKLNVLLITVDDMNWDSIGTYGCRVDDITPNIDRLASQGLRFIHSHVTIAVCQPCRETLMTGRYPHRAGVIGFRPIDRNVPTLQESLAAAGYHLGILGKVTHLAPRDKFCWNYVKDWPDLGAGRDPNLYYRYAKEFFKDAKAQGKPFFMMANSHDPHRPFAGSDQEKARFSRMRTPDAETRRQPDQTGQPTSPPLPTVRRQYRPDEIDVPGFLPELPEVRLEISEYYSSVHRADETVGAVLEALEETGSAEETLVMFLSDHGMPLPFAKTNCYLHSTRTPWIVRWPAKLKPNTIDDDHFISGIDFMPTILDALGLPHPPGMDGHSFLGVLLGERQPERDHVITHFDRTAGKNDYPMRAVQDKQFGYIFNAWSDGQTVFKNESQAGRTMRAMIDAAPSDSQIAARVKLFLYRVPEELYDFRNDPDALNNLADDPKYLDRLRKYRRMLLKHLKDEDDPNLEAFRQFLLPEA